MSEIPESILKMARGISADFWSEQGLTNDAAEIRAGDYDKGAEIALIARAIMAEREACAKIFYEDADEMQKRHDKMVDDGIGYASIYRREAETSRKAAERIRNR